jgi:hypothetical protein
MNILLNFRHSSVEAAAKYIRRCGDLPDKLL